MEREICIGGVEFSNPYRTWSYMRNHPNSCNSGPGAPPCQCDPLPIDPSPFITVTLDEPGEGTWAGELTSPADLTVTAVVTQSIGAYVIGEGGPCLVPDTPPTSGWTTTGAPGPFPYAISSTYDTTDGAGAACSVRRYTINEGPKLLGYLYELIDTGTTTARRFGWDPIGAAFVGWLDAADAPVAFARLGSVDDDPTSATVYTDPATDDAPWYDPADPRSADVIGVWIDDLALSSPHLRTAGNRQWGGTLSMPRLGRRELTLGGRVYVRSAAAAEYARQWCYEVLMNSPCGEAGCRLPTVELLSYCNTDDPAEGVRYLHEVGLIDWAWNLDTTDPINCFVRFTATLAAKVPWLTKLPEVVHTGLVLASPTFCDLCGNMLDADTACAPRVVTDPLALQCGCTDQPARAIPTAQRSECYVRPLLVARQYVPITNTKLWTDGALRFTIQGGTDGDPNSPGLKNLRIRAYSNPNSLTAEDGDLLLCGSDPCADVQIGCVPYGATMIIDGSTRRATVSIADLARSANPYLSSGGGKFTFPEYSCGDLMLAIDTDGLQTSADSTITVETIEVERG